MKIIRHGDPLEYRFECWVCGCIFVADKDECSVRTLEGLGCDGIRYTEHVAICKCPDCGKEISVNESIR